jgi:pilus assembly protein CpaB
MKLRSFALIGLSLVLSLFVVILLRSHEMAASADVPMARAVAAKTLLNFGDRITPANLQVMSYPPESVPEGAFSKIEDIAGPGEERVALRTMLPGELVLASKVSGNGGRATLSTMIDKGMRAVTVGVNDIKGVAGFIQVSDRVDVLLTREHLQTVVLLQNVKVLGIDQQSDDKKDKPVVAKAVTLEVSPEDAQKLTLGSSIGSLSLALRNYSSADSAMPRSLSINDLVPAEKVAEPIVQATKPSAPRHSIEILRGTDATSYEVGKDGTVTPTVSPTGAPKLPMMPRLPVKAPVKS